MIEPSSAPALPLTWLVRLRWGAVFAQAVTVLVGAVALGAHVGPPALIVIAATATSNVALHAFGWARRPARPGAIGALLVMDTLALTALLVLCGGASNPFSTLYLVYVTLAALALGMRWASLVVCVSAASYALLFLPRTSAVAMAGMHRDAPAFSAHLQAMWVAFTLTAALVAYFVARVAEALRRRDRELADAHRVAARAEKLASLSALAAGAAHELGTPLGTIAVASRDLALALQRCSLDVLAEDARLIRGEVDRCQRILREMSGRSGEPMGEAPEPVALDDLVREVRVRAGASRLPVDVEADVPRSVIVPVRGLVQSLESLVRNAFDAGGSADAVRLHVLRGQDRLRFEVEDRGAGIPKEALARVGEPFFTTKPQGKGMGLGLFLAHAFAQRWQGRLALESQPGQGTRAVLELPFAAQEVTDVR